MLRTTTVLATVAGATALLPSTALAHVSFHPNAIPQGSFITTDLRVPNEESSASTTSIRVKLPEGVLDALGAPPAGWRFSARTRKLARPIRTDDGTVTSEVTEVDFTGGRIEPGEFANFPIALSLPAGAKRGDVVGFPTVQTYSNGDIVRWIGDPSADHPAPTIDVTAPGTAALDVTGGDAGPPARLPSDLAGVARTPATSTPAAAAPAATVVTRRQTSTLSVIALIVGALGLGAGGLALATRRRGAGAGVS